jgi:hypothetical protein
MKKGEWKMENCVPPMFGSRGSSFSILDLRFAICDRAAGGGNPGSSHNCGQFGFRHRTSSGFETAAMLCRQITDHKSQI